MACDAVRDRVVLFGGSRYESGTVRYSDETWTWDGNFWRQQFLSVNPPPASKVQMSYDSFRRRLVSRETKLRPNFAVSAGGESSLDRDSRTSCAGSSPLDCQAAATGGVLGAGSAHSS